ncbi:MAG: PAS domain S-box protein [Pseudomonadota bacterium]|nr:PAS domain S-box protein [Pseudomonadota bacterium]
MPGIPPIAVAPLPLGVDEPGVFRSLFIAYPDALIVADADGRIVLANPAAAALLGYSVEELVGCEIDALVPDAVRPRHATYRAAFGRNPRARPMGTQMELVARRKDGSEVMVEIALSPLQDHGLPLVVAAIRDIAAYPRMKQALRRAHYSELLAQLGRLAVDTRDPQVLLDRVPVTATHALGVDVAMVYLLDSSMLQLRVASAVGTVAGEAVGERVANRPDTSLGFVMAQGRSITVPDYRIETRFAVPPTYLDEGLTSALAVPISDQGRTIGVLAVRSREARSFGDDEVGFLESLANLLASSLQRARSEEDLNHAQRLESVGQLTGGIAHDFNNLLTVIQGNLQVLEELPGIVADVHGQQLVGAAIRASRRGAELTSKLLAFSRRQLLQPSAVDVNGLLHSLADMLRRTLDQRIGIEVDVPPDQLSVLADPGQLESALLNIAINARDAMPDGGTLRFHAAACAGVPDEIRNETDPSLWALLPQAGFVAISIADSGAGMSEDVKERAFEPFFTTKAAGRGTGLGLSTVYGFVKQSKGAVRVDSAPGAGTTLTLYIPTPPDVAAAPAEGPSTADSIPAGLGVLLVEDDAEVRAVVRQFLVALGCRVTEAASGEQALLALEPARPFGLLVTDIALGAGMRGTTLAAEVTRTSPATAVLLMSGFSVELLQADRDTPPAWELLRKPCSREELAQAIGRAIRTRPA